MKARKATQAGLVMPLMLLLLSASCILAGCGQPAQYKAAEEDKTAPAAVIPTPVETPPKHSKNAERAKPDDPVVAEKTAPPEEISVSQVNLVEDWLAWYQFREGYRQSGRSDERMEAAFEEKAKQLHTTKPGLEITDSLELLAFDWTMEDAGPGAGKDATFRASWLFYKNGDIPVEPNHEFFVILRGRPDPSHLHYLSAKVTGGRDYFDLYAPPVHPDTEWKKGEYYLVTATKQGFACVPYRMEIILKEAYRKDDGKLENVRDYGKRQYLGWYADLGEDGE